MGLSKSSPVCRLAIAVLALSLSACASAIHGTRQKIEVHTDPPGALAMAEGQSVTTPGVLNLQRKLKDAAIRIEKDGYRPEVVRINRSLSGALWWNLVLIPTGAAAGWAATPEESGLDHMWDKEENGALAALILPLVFFWVISWSEGLTGSTLPISRSLSYRWLTRIPHRRLSSDSMG